LRLGENGLPHTNIAPIENSKTRKGKRKNNADEDAENNKFSAKLINAIAIIHTTPLTEFINFEKRANVKGQNK